MDEMNNTNATPETNVSTGRSKFDNFATGFCITGAAISIGNACVKGGKFIVNKIKNRKKKDVVPEADEE